jgi:hypothetical protein
MKEFLKTTSSIINMFLKATVLETADDELSAPTCFRKRKYGHK